MTERANLQPIDPKRLRDIIKANDPVRAVSQILREIQGTYRKEQPASTAAVEGDGMPTGMPATTRTFFEKPKKVKRKK